MNEAQQVPPGVDPTRPSAGRMYDYYLGGTENYEVDRIAVETIRAKMPELEDGVWANRGFLQRASRWLAAERGIEQFIDIGAGLPTRNNTHEAVHSVNPDARVVYVDNDPMVSVHARAMLADTPNTLFVTGDFRRPEEILDNPEVRAFVDLAKPTGLVLAGVVHFVADELDPWALVKRYLDALAPGSHLALSHITADRNSPEVVKTFHEVYANATEQVRFRSYEDVARFFVGLEMVPPYDGAPAAVSHTGEWGAEDPALADSDGSRWGWCGVARKPPLGVDLTRPTAARLYDYVLGGTNNFEVDRAAAERARVMVPELEDIAWANRGFHQRAARWLATEGGITQFIDIGSGLPTQNNTHQVVQAAVPDAHVVYLDNDPSVAAHAQELLVGATHATFIPGDVSDPEALLEHPDLRALIDLRRPVGVFMSGLMHLVSDESDPPGLVARWMSALVPGSYLGLSHMTHDRQAPEAERRMRTLLERTAPLYLRTQADVERMFAGLELVPPYDGAGPAVTYAGLWAAEDPEAADSDGSRWLYAGVARKP